jgi:hypothetical protein
MTGDCSLEIGPIPLARLALNRQPHNPVRRRERIRGDQPAYITLNTAVAAPILSASDTYAVRVSPALLTSIDSSGLYRNVTSRPFQAIAYKFAELEITKSRTILELRLSGMH